ncbi:MAG: hypothetical protein JSV91_16105 [Phycisphaerales bacterium]|nr:MAG: hypothetical protein JSV91_16105 [Phycisphaerales bacterium]
MKIAAIVLSGAAILTVAVPASADYILDQNQPNAYVYMAAFSQTDLAQSFQTQNYNHIAGAGIYLWLYGNPGNVTISLWDFLPNQGGTMLTSATAVGTPNSWFDVYWDPVPITPNTTYYLVFTDDNTGMGIAGDTANPYPYGCVYANAGFQQFPNYDYTFRTWVVPAPGALALLGLAGLVRRRRR